MREGWIRKRKRPSGEGLWGAYEVARDEHGVWLYTPEGSRYRGTNPDGTVGECFAGQPESPGVHVMQLVPSGDGWWIGHWKIYRENHTLSIDVCTPTEKVGDEWAYVDLELDLYKSTDGTVGIFDEDEFADAIAGGLISEHERRVCIDTAAELDARLRSVDPVFDDIAWSRLDAAIALQLPPITAFA
jgi:hypothetical protein